MRNSKYLDLGFSPFCEYLFIFGQIQKYLVYCYLVSRYLINRNVWIFLKYLVYSDSHLNVETRGKVKFIAVTYLAL
jgi:hypothetical protein